MLTCACVCVQVCFACVDAEEFKIAQQCGLFVIVEADELEDLVYHYEVRLHSLFTFISMCVCVYSHWSVCSVEARLSTWLRCWRLASPKTVHTKACTPSWPFFTPSMFVCVRVLVFCWLILFFIFLFRKRYREEKLIEFLRQAVAKLHTQKVQNTNKSTKSLNITHMHLLGHPCLSTKLAMGWIDLFVFAQQRSKHHHLLSILLLLLSFLLFLLSLSQTRWTMLSSRCSIIQRVLGSTRNSKTLCATSTITTCFTNRFNSTLKNK